MFLPIIEKGYDGVFYPIYKCCAKTDAGSPTEIAMAFCAFLLTIPALVASMAGFGVDGFESATDGLVNLAEASAAMDVAGVGADLLSNVVWSDRQHNAARNIQRRFKNKLATKQAPTMDPFVLAMKRASKVDPKRMPQTSALDQPKLKVKVRRLKHSESRSMEGQVALGCKPNSVTTETACAKPGPGSGHTDEPNGAGQSRQNIVSQVNSIACSDRASACPQGPVWTSPSQTRQSRAVSQNIAPKAILPSQIVSAWPQTDANTASFISSDAVPSAKARLAPSRTSVATNQPSNAKKGRNIVAGVEPMVQESASGWNRTEARSVPRRRRLRAKPGQQASQQAVAPTVAPSQLAPYLSIGIAASVAEVDAVQLDGATQ